MCISHRRRDSQQSAFTLIELLVVIAIIAILASILLPTLAKAKMKTTGAFCMSNERQLTLAFMMYANDNANIMPSSTNFNNKVMYGGGYWPGPSPAIGTGITEDEAKRRVQNGLSEGPLWTYCREFGVYHCPGDLRFKYRKPGAKWAYDSYSKVDGMNGNMWNLPAFKHLDTVPEPGRSMVFMEEAESRNHNLGTWVINADSRAWVDPVAIFHNGSSTISFADGHVEIHRWLEKSTIDAAAAAQKGSDTPFFWNKAPNDRDFAWVEPRYKYVGWPRYMPR